MAMPSLLRFLVLLTAAGAAVSQVAAWVDCGDASSSPPPSPSPSPSPSPLSTPTNGSSHAPAPFRANLLTLLGALPRAAAPTGFASLCLGAGRDRAFVRGLCRGDFQPPRCLAELQEAVRTLGGSCSPSSRRAAVWLDVYVAYADTNASTPREDDLREILYDKRLVAHPAAYLQAYGALMRHLVARAVGGGEAGTTTARQVFFATGEARYASDDPNGTMYGMVQCMRDITAADCDRCLQASVPQLPCGVGNQGGVVLAYNCFLRIQVYTYYDLALDAAPVPSPSSPTPAAETSGTGRRRNSTIILAVVVPLGTLLLLAFVLTGVYLRRRRGVKERGRAEDDDDRSTTYVHPGKFTLPVLRVATGDFAAVNKLGEGGFGEVFKGRLQDGQCVAVKRLSRGSSQGFHELKNELILAAKLTHRNLVQLLGVCLEETEKLIVYEYLPNRSLDTILFGRRQQQQQQQALDWSKRYTIIHGIARGLLYLHEESRMRIIHRDLKPSNVLLDSDMAPKISDFGLARAFWGDESREVTKRPVGTLGYMSPEYAYYGHVSTKSLFDFRSVKSRHKCGAEYHRHGSVATPQQLWQSAAVNQTDSKSDMFSFGVIVLEIVTGQRNSSPSVEDDGSGRNLLSYVWEKWRRGSVAETVDASLGGQYARAEAVACVQIGLLCVQKDPGSRPDASEVVLMLDGRSAIQQKPCRPAFCSGSVSVAAASARRAARGNAASYGRRRAAMDLFPKTA